MHRDDGSQFQIVTQTSIASGHLLTMASIVPPQDHAKYTPDGRPSANLKLQKFNKVNDNHQTFLSTNNIRSVTDKTIHIR